MRIVLDTNVLVSALLFGGIPQEIIDLVSEGEVQLVISPPLFSELKEVLEEKFNLSRARTGQHLADLWAVAHIVTPRKKVRVFAGKDEPDNRVLECAVQGRVDAVVTGDRKILRRKSYQGIPILAPAQFLTYFRTNR